MGKGRDKRKRAQEEHQGGRNKAKHDRKQKEKNLEKHSRRLAKEQDVDDLPEADIELMLAQYRNKEDKRREVRIEDCEAPSPRTNASFMISPHVPTEAVLFGGEHWNGDRTESFNGLYRYNLEKNTWKAVVSAHTPTPRSSHQAVCYKHFMLVFGGEFTSPSQSQFFHHRDLWRLDLNAWKWTEMKMKDKSGPTARSGHRMVLWKRTGVLFGGFHDTMTAGGQAHYYDDVWLLSGLDETPKWEKLLTKGEGPCKRSGVCQSIYGDTMYLYGGFAVDGKFAKGTCFADLWTLNLSSGQWTRIKKLGIPPSVRSGMSCVSVGRKAIFFGGVTDLDDQDDVKSRFFNDMYQLDMDSRRWFPLMLRKRKKGAGAASTGRRETKRAKRRGAAEAAAAAEEAKEVEAAEGSDAEDDSDDSDTISDDDDLQQAAMPALPSAKKKQRPQHRRSQKTARVLADIEAQERKEKAAQKAETAKIKQPNRLPIFIGGALVGYEEVTDDTPEKEGDAKKKKKHRDPEADEDGGEEEEEQEEEEQEQEEGEQEEEEEDEKAPAVIPADVDFVPASTFQGSRDGFAFKQDEQGLGYYRDVRPKVTFQLPDPDASRQIHRGSHIENGEGQIVPCGRFGTMLAAGGNFLYLYGGQFEDGAREVTLGDLFRLNVNKLDTFEPRVEMDLSKHDWYESDEEEDAGDQQKKAKAEDSSDSEAEEEEEEEEDDDGDEDEQSEDEEGDKPVRAKGRKGQARREQLLKQLESEEGLPAPEPGETLRDFAARTSDFWAELSTAEHSAAAAADGSEVCTADAKSLRKEAFRLASRRFQECRPILDAIEALDSADVPSRGKR
eukprot:Hpha_TRINITY_DN15915_c5_g10::TRINITY_DN15915_c5_g10_i1::g.73274::m.73274